MIDFIEYVVAELKSKRLSKANAAALVRQFARRSSGSASTAAIHPLLHRNTSDLSEQRYSSTFSGDEFFLVDHQVKGQKVLPGVAYLEMARAAIEQALPQGPQSAVLELRNTVWAQPVVVSGKKEVNIALSASDDEQIDYEVYSDEGVHAQGRAAFGNEPAPAALNLESLQTGDVMTPASLYATCERMGLRYGPSFQSVTAIHRGNGQVLARLRLPDSSGDFVLHPSLMDGALQAAVGLLEGEAEAGQPLLPFALDTLRVIAPCTSEMSAWLRYAPGSSAGDKVLKLDIDLCDEQGNVCVQMRGFTWRVLSGEIALPKAAETLLAVPKWEEVAADAKGEFVIEYEASEGTLAERYTAFALTCFERIQTILRSKPQGRVLVQVVVPADEPVFAGLTGLLRTAELENPQFTGQLILGSTHKVLRWEEVAADTQPPIAFKDHGVYLITGGTGGLGLLFANEILRQAPSARVILTGRSARTAPPGMEYRQLDLGNAEEVREVIASIGRIDGILHCAGMIADSFLLKKTADDFRNVLAPKVAGTFHLDQATKDVALDFFVLFSAIGGALGNHGQADYAAANGFLDHFAVYRNRLVAAGERHGRTRSINWPLWQDGGMGVDEANRERLRETTGMVPMQTATGFEAFYRSLALPGDQLLVAQGDVAVLREALLAPPAAAEPEQPVIVDATGLEEKTQDYLRKQFSAILKVPAAKIDPRAALENYGIDSILAMKLTNQLETTFGSLSKTLFFEYQTIRELADYFIANHAAQLTAIFSPAKEGGLENPPYVAPAKRRADSPVRPSRRAKRAKKTDDDPIAIVGLSGRYPQAVDLDAYWQNLRDGKDCITEVPKERWDWREYFSEDRTKSGRHYSKWGGFIAGVDEFDPLFFNISPLDAESIDPQERLFLQHAWMAIEDAGYTRATLQGPGDVGVYAGVMYIEYQLLGSKRRGVPASAASIANRVSYALNLHGPSMTLDTMCSSSLTAIHIACEDLKHRRTSLAIAGGVNVSIHPNKYLVLSDGQFISSDGHCQSFGEGGDGYIPGEGVGVVVLKRPSDAERDGDHIYGVIRGSALTHGGKTNGYSVPNPQAQAGAISRALTEAHVDARHISYIEAHGTGTKLGDPIEIAALSKAFQQHTSDTEFCLIGSAKSNIGHCESAAGIAGLTKVLLQMQHRQIVPSLHSAQLNPHIDFGKSPFTVNQTLREWEQPVVDGRKLPRIAGISSFGAGGSNAHVIIEEYQAPVAQAASSDAPVAIVLSARTAEQLRQKAADLLGHLRLHTVDLADVAWTLQVGREAMDERLAFVVSSPQQLVEKIEAWLAGGKDIDDVYQGQVRRNSDTLALFHDADLQQAIDKWLASRKLPKLLELWARGLDLDWSKLHGGTRRRVSLPAYPFARERYWIDTKPDEEAHTAAVLHPLLHSNTSDLNELRYRSTFTGEEFFLTDHQVAGRKVLPGVAYLEMARAAVQQASPVAGVVELRNTVWAQPIVVSEKKDVAIALVADDDDGIDFEVYSDDDVVHCQGRAVASGAPTPAPLDLEQLRSRMHTELAPDAVYATLGRMGLAYGPAFQSIAAIHRGANELLAEIRRPEIGTDYILHPSVMDGALQSCVALMDGAGAEPRVPFALETLRIFAPCTAEMTAWVRAEAEKVDIDLCDAEGNVCVQMHGFSTRAMRIAETGSLIAIPAWQASAPDAGAIVIAYEESAGTLAERYTAFALTCFERIQGILRSKPQGRVQVQVVVPEHEPVLAGLAGLLRTAELENPQFTGQLIVGGSQRTLAWQEVAQDEAPAPIAFRNDGTYLITGGMGGLGTIFAKEILRQAPGARVILTGRSARTSPEGLIYRQVDLGSADEVRELIESIGPLNGILHSAGMIGDSFILNKDSAHFCDVLEPKVAGTYNLDQATKDTALDFFVLFSSVAAVAGNVGQADYAAANGFLDQFAAYRNRLVSEGQRHGRTRSINWPLWQAGGMTVDASRQELLLQATGLQPMRTATGIEAFHRALALPYDQTLVVEGDLAQLRRTLLAGPVLPVEAEPAANATVDADKTEEYLRKQFAGVMKMPSHQIDPQAALEEYGIDSILAMKLTAQLEKTFGSLPKTLFFEYQTIRELAGYFAANHAAKLGGLENPPYVAPAERRADSPVRPSRRAKRVKKTDDDPIAIVGLSGRYPEAIDVDAYWRNLRDGKDCITEVPKDRWDWREYFSADRSQSGRHYSKWGGFIQGVDEFDPLFFSISPVDAERIDPQERLFLQHAWMAIEDAGYTRAALPGSSGDVGVYAGVMYNEYQLFGAEASARGKRLAVPGSTASIANRVSYALNLHGPSVTLDTMCSSSLTAIHFACQDLKLGRTSLAIAGGVNVTVHPNKYLVLSGGQFISSDGHCQSFGEGGDGYIPGEGVGVVVLKRLSDAKRDGDHIYGVIRGSALNHGGKTNGYTVPNPQAQANAIARALAEAHIDARHVSYIEAHGTGTTLGDPIEIAALSKAFGHYTQDTGYCLIGSAKSNIGHCESAAGIAGLTKVLLQMQHRQIVPSLHSVRLNPHIDFESTPFVVNQTLRDWEQPVVDGKTLPRIAGISSFGAGGSNAHLIIEEYQAEARQPMSIGNVVVPLSARTPEQLRQKAADLLEHLRRGSVDLAAAAYTLQVGREAMEERLAFIVSSTDELIDKLESMEDAYRGQVKRTSDALAVFSADADLQQTVDRWIASRKLPKLVDLWVKGLDLDWGKLYGEARPERVSLPTYPFARERYWIDVAAGAVAGGATTAVLHPLLHVNASDLSEQRYRSTFTGEEFFLADHQVQGQKMLPGVAYLEMARAAMEQALPEPAVLELRDIAWLQPIIVSESKEVGIALSADDAEQIAYEIYSGDTIHCEGRAVLSRDAAPAALDLAQLRARMAQGQLERDSVYEACARMGLVYGPSFRGIAAIHRGTDELLVEIRLPEIGTDYVLHPSVMDSALQACVALVGAGTQPRVPFALESLRVFAPCTAAMNAWVRVAGEKVDIDLCDERGNVCVAMRGLASRVMGVSSGSLLAVPVWQPGAMEDAQHVIRLSLQGDYTEQAIACFEKVQEILRSNPAEKVVLQVAIGGAEEQALLAGLSGLLKTAEQENPQFRGQLIIDGVPQVLSWQEVPTDRTTAPIAFKDGGVYLITGGMGGLGTIFAQEIRRQAPNARVILTGRSARTAPDYRQLDLGNADEVRALIAFLTSAYGRVDGILHSAGMTSDCAIVKKTSAEFAEVLAPKVAGTVNLDLATKDLELDFFVLFSSVAGATGNAGQADYAAANGFLDRFAAYRNRLVAAGQRHGRTRSINWPLWEAGGMGSDPAFRERLAQATGMQPMQTATGLDAFYRSLALPHDQLLVVEGDVAKIRRGLNPAPVKPTVAVAGNLIDKAQDYLRKECAELMKLPAHKIDPQAALEQYGIDSILAMRLTSQMEKTFGPLSKTLFFEYQTIAALAEYFVREYPEKFERQEEAPKAAVVETKPAQPKKRNKSRFVAAKANAPEEIAIVGLGGRYPQAANLQEFWRNLQNGRDCITEVPAERWDHKLYFDADPKKAGKSYTKWGGFIDDVDKFDPLFFNISPREAELMDPQERLFLQTAWETIEDAGYSKESVSGRRVGVFVGVMWGQYELYGAESVLRGTAAALPGSSYASIANRVSYFFDFHGPSIALDTMCSSSLTAIHLACEELRRGEIDAAIAGGVNVTIHPYKYLGLSQGKFAASDGRCRSFGAGGDGYVPGEGVGAVLLKPLAHALRDGDQIYAVIRSSSVNHGGKTNGYTVPNPNAQGDLIRAALEKAKIDPRTLSYIETHGTGTSLGDPIEITGLMRAFQGATDTKQFCAIGSVKSNIGHLESAAGIAAVTKALLQLRHKQLVPSLHADPLNPNIRFEESPFYVQTALAEWKRPDGHPRRAGVSSFGAGGSNAHLILEEYAEAAESASSGQEIFVLSAKNPDALRRYAQRFIDDLRGADLAGIAYTSQVGRTAMDARLAVLASSVDELRAKLAQWLAAQAEADGVFAGNAREQNAGILIAGAAGKSFVETLVAHRDLERLARLWTLGVDVDWTLLERQATPRRRSLPTYPFAKERYWVRQETPATTPVRTSHERTTWVPQWTPEPLGVGSDNIGPILVIDSSDELARALNAVENVNPRVIVHHAAEGENGLHTLLPFVKGGGPRRILSVSTGSPLAAATAGFLKTLALEDPTFEVKVVEMERVDPALIRAELSEVDWTAQEIRYRGAQRLVRTLVSRPESGRGELPLRQNGVYLITGGTGGLGLIFAEYLAKQYAAKLVLVSRSARQQEKLGADVLVLQGDVANREDMERVVREAKARFGAIHGVIHSAGVTRDALIARKTREEIDAVLAPKVDGAINLDLATSGEELDFFVLFASLAGVTGNAGQCDYAFANRFLDAFAEERAGRRPGRTLSIDWPLWEEGGMSIPADRVALIEQQTGIAPLPTEEGIRYWEELLRSDATQAVALYGNPSRIAAAIAARPVKAQPQSIESVEAYLKALIGEEIMLAADRIGSTDPLESFGLDSVMINQINARLERDLGALPKTLLYEHETVRDVAMYLVREGNVAPALQPAQGGLESPPPRFEQPLRDDQPDDLEAVAIIGIHGSYPHSATMEEYWENLKQGRDLIDLVPSSRWDSKDLYCKWGGFLEDFDKFDPHFFKISTAEAEVLDPQERLFLQSVWAAIEDAGYTRERLKARFPKAGSANVGVFVGVTTNTYTLCGPDNAMPPTAMPWSIANRVSYFFDFNGPSLPVDTACSSSLVAIHLACESLRNRECKVAVAGGVNLYLHPAKYQSLCQRRMVSTDGKTHSYGAGDDGFVPGEGVGTLVLKPLRQAIEDQDRIYAVIRSSAYDHAGRSNGYSAPNPNAQASLISRTLEKANVHPETIGYIEGHGTGTQLGDSIEVAALTKAFQTQTAKKQFCPIGSVKANIGHSESAAGVAGLAKVILQMQHGQLAPSIHSDEVNPNIEFGESPFYLQHALSEWPASPAHPRRALVNSFGAGGVNACVLVEQFDAPAQQGGLENPPYVFTLSAKNEERLRDYAARLLECLPAAHLSSLCHTLHGREGMEERLALVVSDAAELADRLQQWLDRAPVAGLHRGTLGPRRGSKRNKATGTDLNELAAKWVAGEEVDWDSLYTAKPGRIALPTYPFARERYWVSDATPAAVESQPAPQLHPLITCNSSTLKEVRFSSQLSDSAFYAVDHQVHGERIFPGAGFLEMACVAANLASEQRVRKIKDVVWMQPLSFRSGAQSLRTVLKHAGDHIEYVISSVDEENEPIVHSEGSVALGNARVVPPQGEERLSPDDLKASCGSPEAGTVYYERLRANGLHYGPAFQTIQELWLGDAFALSKLRIADSLKSERGHFILHPSLIDGALQTIAGLVARMAPETTCVPFTLDEIEIVRPVPQTCYAYVQCAGGRNNFHIRLLNESGELVVRFKNLYVRPLAKPEPESQSTGDDVLLAANRRRL